MTFKPSQANTSPTTWPSTTASSCRWKTRWTRSWTGSPRRAGCSGAAPARVSTCPSCARRRSSCPRAATRPARSRSCAAKMVVLNVDHPDIEEFIWCKQHEEEKARVLQAAGYDMSLDSPDWASIQYQNANNSVRVTDEFMRAVLEDEKWNLTARTDGSVVGTVRARDLMHQISEAAWKCADPGMHYDTTMNDWHTCPASGRINASNPCSEYLHVDNSACNLASLNLLKFRDPETGEFQVERFERAVDIIFMAQDILVGNSTYP